VTMTVCHFHPAGVRCRRQRCGTMLLELIAAMALFGVVLTIAVPVVTNVAAVREESRRRQIAQLELGNIMEQIAARRLAGESTAAAARLIALSPQTASQLPAARLTVDAAEESGTPRSTLITARLVWTMNTGRAAAPAELCAFFRERAAGEVTP
jgi:type II secretory pathway pseudopilin PulG